MNILLLGLWIIKNWSQQCTKTHANTAMKGKFD